MTTLQPPISLNQTYQVTSSSFAVPSLPTRPLGMSQSSNLPDPGGVSTPRLKRLSLVPKSSSGATHLDSMTSPNGSSAAGPSTPRSARRNLGSMRSSISYSPAGGPRTASSLSFDVPTPKRGTFSSKSCNVEDESKENRGIRNQGIPGDSRERLDKRWTETSGTGTGAGIGTGSRSALDSDAQSKSDEESRRRTERKGETLVERHADLLTLIAQRERRVNELKQELASQEASLAQLKSRWTTIVTRSTQPQVTQTPRPSSASIAHRSTPSTSQHPLTTKSPAYRPKSMTMPLSTSQSFHASSSTSPTTSGASLHQLSSRDSSSSVATSSDIGSPDNTPSISSLLASLNTTEGLISVETVESSKRFWGQLVKTVSAAAGGTVPLQESNSSSRISDSGQNGVGEGDHEAQGSFDLSSLKSLLPAAMPIWPVSPSATPTTKQNGDRDGTRRSHAKPLRPANAARLRSLERIESGGGDVRRSSPTGSFSSMGESSESSTPRDQDGGGAMDLMGEEADLGGRVLTPLRSSASLGNEMRDTAKKQDTVQAGKDGKDQERGDDDEDGWGW